MKGGKPKGAGYVSTIRALNGAIAMVMTVGCIAPLIPPEELQACAWALSKTFMDTAIKVEKQ